ncbi:MAG: amino acid--tRNA ligase-related protein, partial [Oscillospiraceae bacterium]
MNEQLNDAPEVVSQEDLAEQTRIRREKLEELCSEGKSPFDITTFERTSDSQTIIKDFDKLENQDVSIAGRIMTCRIMGKAAFADIWDHKGRIQVYVRIDAIGEENFKEFKKWDLGDIVGLTGYVFKTKKGEISVHVKEITLLSKSLYPLPDKWHGLKDTDTKYRQRYLDLITSLETRDVFLKRSKIITEIRRFLDSREYLEVETPILGTLAGGAAARPFVTHHNALNVEMYMRIALELHLKRLIIGGFDKVYEVSRVFRNEGVDTRHNPEFTLL